jgi:diketogulonate reductase-like aldo/keto reductase
VVHNETNALFLQDSAEWYENEREVGQAIGDFLRKHSLPRSDIFYTTKLKANDGFEASKRAIKKSLKDCGLGYIDLYLIHGPEGGRQMRIESWEACLWAKQEGLVKTVGISTFGVRHMQELKEWIKASPEREMPSIHQVISFYEIYENPELKSF